LPSKGRNVSVQQVSKAGLASEVQELLAADLAVAIGVHELKVSPQHLRREPSMTFIGGGYVTRELLATFKITVGGSVISRIAKVFKIS